MPGPDPQLGALAAEAAAARGGALTVRQVFRRRFLRHRLAVGSLVFLILLALGTTAAPLVESWLGVDGNLVDLFNAKQPPSPQHPLGTDRSEEHTSELQSLMRISYAVFCLKKKT